MNKVILLLLLSFCVFTNLNSQNCNYPSPPTYFCETAPIVCPLDGYCSTNENYIPGPIQVPNTFCGTIQNANWIGFIAASTVLDVNVNVDICQGTPNGIGLQAMVFESCNSWNMVSNCLYQILPNSTSTLSMNNLVVGQTYYILIDGFSGDICNFNLQVVNGATATSSSLFLSDAGPDMELSCPGAEVTLDGSNSTFDPNATIEWRDINNNILGTDTTLNVSSSGIYYFIHTDTVNGCNSLDIVEVSLGGVFSFGLIEEEPLACDGPMEINTTNVPTGSQYSYQWSTADGNIVSGSNSIAATVDATGTYFLEVTDTVDQCSKIDSILIYDFMNGFADSLTQSWNCNTAGNLTLPSVITSTGLDNLTWNWTTVNGQIILGQNSISPTVGGPGSYNYTVFDDTGCSVTGTVIVTDDVVVPTISIAVSDVLSCINPSITLDAITSGVNFNYSWNFNGIIIGNSPSITVTQEGIYQLTVTDWLTGCSATESVTVVADVDVPVFSITTNNVELNCANNFTQIVSINGPTGNNIIYDWTGPNGFSATGIDVEISGNIEGAFDITATNLDNGCFSTQSFVVVNNGFDMDITTTMAGCDLADGTAMVTTGLANPSFAWSTGATTNAVTDLAQGGYSVTVTDVDNNCSKHENFYIEEDISCKVVISGYVINDPNITCTYDSNMEGMECLLVKLEPLGIYTLTDTTGYYEFIVDDGTYTVEYIGGDFVDLQCPMPGSYDVTLDMNGTTSDDNHFFVIRKDIDLCVTKFTGNARPGLSQFNCVDICNYGVETTNATVTFVHDSIFSDVPPLPNIDPININAENYIYDAATNTFTWELIDLQPGECRKIMWYMEVPVSAQIGDVISAEAKVNPIDNDANPDNNCLDWLQAVTGSYDPNDKRNFVGETQWGGAIYEDDLTMDYAIRFQNVGNDTAFTVVIRDTLDDAHLNVETIRGFSASHAMQVEFEGHNELIFRFENILLPDSTTNEEASNGWVVFQIDRFDDLPFGTEIDNQAAIYFDFNAPVITNEVVNVLTNPVSVFSPQKNTLQMKLLPSFTEDLTTVNFILGKSSPASLTLLNVEGIRIKSFNLGNLSEGEHQHEVSLKELPAGIYFVVLETEDGIGTKRILKY